MLYIRGLPYWIMIAVGGVAFNKGLINAGVPERAAAYLAAAVMMLVLVIVLANMEQE